MKLNLKITIFYFAWMVFISPLLAFTSVNSNNKVNNKIESCSVMGLNHKNTTNKMESCCKTDSKQEKSNNHCGNCNKECKGDCKSGNCYTTNTVVLTFVENTIKSIEVPIFFSLRLENKYYQSLHIKDIYLRFWNPPKHIS